MKKAFFYIPLLAIALTLTAASTAMALSDDLLADSLAGKISVSYVVWDAYAGKFITQKASVAEDSTVLANNVDNLVLDFYTDPDGGDFLNIFGETLMSNGKAVLEYTPDNWHLDLGMPVSGRGAAGSAFAWGYIVVSGDRTYDEFGTGSGAGAALEFYAATLVKAVGKEDGMGNVNGSVKIKVYPYSAVLRNYTGTGNYGPASEVYTSARIKMSPIKFKSFASYPNPYTPDINIPLD